MLFRAKPTIVEAHWIPEDPTGAEIQEVRDWLRKRGFNGYSMEDRGAFSLYRGSASVAYAPYGRWLVVLGEQDVSVLKPKLFEQTYEWIGPKAYADPPYLVN